MTTRPAVSAHRGGTERAAPATWEAYQDALASGAEYVEFDVRRTADGALVVHHDARVGGTGPLLSTLTRAELDARAGHPVPLVDDVMELIAGRLVAHLDLKETGYERELLDRAVALLGRTGASPPPWRTAPSPPSPPPARACAPFSPSAATAGA